MLGSGGHTMEMLSLLQALPRNEYGPLVCMASSGDKMSLEKASTVLSDALASQHPWQGMVLPRARNVGQTWTSTPWSVLRSMAYAVWYIGFAPYLHGYTDRACADILLMNGPATCVPLVVAVWCARICGCPAPRMIYVESIARVSTLSLTGRLLRHVVDVFVVQWPTADPTAFPWGDIGVLVS
ncbi:hypothetical protein Malapachy_2008 [Malassezia pachydermatis]|uniref:UDP-N-acetylglucosamine transferase subunit ALG14 n=1 Tax=Malassezia pachydermatis TaxID=77020 RepID=A0A0M8ML10_9BASI|nr:hypothetical protein Malapachy_2008 [Malassezia pachydermatis]KOS13678.1 hypothetical protein Malapachy_2008 [Malassezia pachydermatis]